jgi:hypothetical protein
MGHVDGKGNYDFEDTVAYVSSKTLMEGNRRGLGGTYRSTTCNQIEQS